VNRTAEFVLGLIGGILGIGVGLFFIIAGLFGSAMETELGGKIEGVEFVFGVGIILPLLSLLSTVFSVPSLIRKNHMLSGIINLAVGALGFFLATILWIIPGILMIISGGLSMRSPKPEMTATQSSAADKDSAETSHADSEEETAEAAEGKAEKQAD
jgi:Na+/H+ antiporter NhaB